MTIVGLVPAAGYATRLQPLPCSKEVYPVGGRPLMAYLVERMRTVACSEIRVITRPEKHDVAAYARDEGLTVIAARPQNVSESFRAGMDGLEDDDVVLLGFPDTIWLPRDGFRPLVSAVDEGAAAALGLFEIDPADLGRSDVIVFDAGGRAAGISVKPANPPSGWIWGCAACRVGALHGIEREREPGVFLDGLCRRRDAVRSVPLSDVWLDVGTPETLRRGDLFAATISLE